METNTKNEQLPHPALKRFEILIGTWDIQGRVSGLFGEVNGQATFEWMAGGFFLSQRFYMNFVGQRIEGLEVIGYDPYSQSFPATVYTNMGISPSYKWDIHDNMVIHSTEGSKYIGRFDPNKNVLTGRWEPEEGKASAGNIAYDATMIRLGSNSRFHLAS